MATEPTVLIVDDDPTSALILERIFAKEGFQTYVANNGLEGRKIAFQDLPDLIFLDVMMPGEDGLETCVKLKHQPETADIPIIFLSSLDQAKDKVTGLTLGAVDYVTKPFDTQEVLARARVHIKLRRAYADLIEAQSLKLRQLQEAQESIMPKPEDIQEARFAVYYSPLNEAGGDFYDVMPIGADNCGYFIADICGHDLGTSFLTAALKVLVAQYAGPLYTPTETIKMINGVLNHSFKEGQYLTACFVLINRRQKWMKLTSAGHLPVIHIQQNGQTQLMESTGDVLGAFESISIDTVKINITDGDRIFLYSDGLVEINDSKKLARSERIDALASACNETLKLPLDKAVNRVIEKLDDDEYPRTDDWLLMGIEV